MSGLFSLMGLTLGLLLIVPGESARGEGASFDDANRLYEQGKYRDAIGAYDAVLQGGAESSAVWFNLGNAHFKAGQVGDAIAAYRQAEQLSPRDPDVRANLAFARRQVTGPTLRASWLPQITNSLTVNEWTLLATVPVWGWFGLMIAGQIKPQWRAGLRRWVWIAGGLGVAGCVVLLVAFRGRFSETTVVVNSRDTVVRAGPFDESVSAFTAADGAEFILHDAKADWYQVADGRNVLGWLKTNAVAVIR